MLLSPDNSSLHIMYLVNNSDLHGHITKINTYLHDVKTGDWNLSLKPLKN
jgi:hypothetical protein